MGESRQLRQTSAATHKFDKPLTSGFCLQTQHPLSHNEEWQGRSMAKGTARVRLKQLYRHRNTFFVKTGAMLAG